MKPLRVALIHHDNPRQYNRMAGFWSYDLPEFDVTHFGVKGIQVYRRGDYRDFDVIVWEDHRTGGTWTHDAKVPLVYHVVDSTLSAGHLEDRNKHAKEADLVLVDHDRLQRIHGKIIRRWSYCVNDRLFHDYGEEKTVDVSFHCRTKGSDERADLRDWLGKHCQHMGYTYAAGDRAGEQYARAFNRSKITVNLTRTIINRPHRVFDAMACRTCLLTSPLPPVSGEEREAGVHYVEWRDFDELVWHLADLLQMGTWQKVADAGHELVHRAHTWPVRARELREILREEFGL